MAAGGGMVEHNHPQGSGVANVAMAPISRLDEPGIGLEDVPHRTLTYAQLRSLDPNPDTRAPGREIELHVPDGAQPGDEIEVDLDDFAALELQGDEDVTAVEWAAVRIQAVARGREVRRPPPLPGPSPPQSEEEGGGAER